MVKQYPYLKDSTFLKYFDGLKNKEQFIKITVLNFEEKPIQSIEGRVTGGSINIDGSSSIRRTCNLSMVASNANNDLTNVDHILSINKKVSVETGFINETNYYTDYNIIWFPLGIYVIINPSLSHELDGVNITLQLKDKMCLLNGECGGVIPASTQFDEYETVDENGEYIIVQPTIYQIIQELVNHFGGEQLGKIIISDVDTRIKKVMKWVGSNPLYMIKDDSQYTLTTDANKAASASATIYEYGEDIGYIYTDFVYTSELIGDAGSTVCDILDKIKDYLGNYEYFYDLDGNFVFQEIKNYLNTSQATVDLEKMSNSDYLVDRSKGKAVYVFDDSSIVTSYSHTPQFNMIKNDFIVWGVREDVLGNTYSIRYHLAIDDKPKVGNTYQVFFYTDQTDNLVKAKSALEYDTKDDFPTIGQAEVFYREKEHNMVYEWDATDKAYTVITIGLQEITTQDWRTELYLQGSIAEPLGIDSNYYYTELKNEWPKLYDVQNGEFYDLNPTDLDFYLDFIDSSAAISEFSISNIGRRSKVVSDDSINCVFEPEIPDFVLIELNTEKTEQLRKECEDQGQDYIQVDSSIYSMIAGGGKFNSAYNMVRELLYQYTSYNSTISVSTIPIYYLEPNTRITVRDPQSGIYGDFMINSISLPLDVSSTMTLSCTQALERI